MIIWFGFGFVIWIEWNQQSMIFMCFFINCSCFQIPWKKNYSYIIVKTNCLVRPSKDKKTLSRKDTPVYFSSIPSSYNIFGHQRSHDFGIVTPSFLLCCSIVVFSVVLVLCIFSCIYELDFFNFLELVFEMAICFLLVFFIRSNIQDTVDMLLEVLN